METKFNQFIFDINYLSKVSRVEISKPLSLNSTYLYLLTLRFVNSNCTIEINRIIQTYLLDIDFITYLNTRTI